jgi:hypothetical protein
LRYYIHLENRDIPFIKKADLVLSAPHIGLAGIENLLQEHPGQSAAFI